MIMIRFFTILIFIFIIVWTKAIGFYPTPEPSVINFTSVAGTLFTINRTNGHGVNRAIFEKERVGTITNPRHNTIFAASAECAPD